MTEKEWMQEGIDLKLTALLFLKKIWIPLLCSFAGAVLAGGAYFLSHVVYAPAREYEAVSKLYLEFASDDDGDAYQYYNGYTWNDLMATEPILGYTMTLLSGMEKEEVKKAVTADILSDIRLLTVTVRTKSLQETEAIARATEESLIHFGQDMKEFEEIRVIEPGAPEMVVIELETVRAVAAGAVAGLTLSLLGLWFACVLDDSVYVPSDFEKRYGYPVFGACFGSDHQEGGDELKGNLDYALKGKTNIGYVEAGSGKQPDYKALRESDGVILKIPYGRGNGKITERLISVLRQQDCEILGAVITEADEKLYRLYFAQRKRKKA